MSKDGTIPLPLELRDKHGFDADTPIRIVETRTGVLLIPLTKAPMNEELKQELAEWQELSISTWNAFPYEEDPS